MQASFEYVANLIALCVEIGATALIAIGVVDAAVRIALHVIGREDIRAIKDIWLRLAGWILLALEFALGADIVRTSITPSWEDVGKLAAIAGIRTLLSVFLERDLASFERDRRVTPRPV